LIEKVWKGLEVGLALSEDHRVVWSIEVQNAEVERFKHRPYGPFYLYIDLKLNFPCFDSSERAQDRVVVLCSDSVRRLPFMIIPERHVNGESLKAVQCTQRRARLFPCIVVFWGKPHRILEQLFGQPRRDQKNCREVQMTESMPVGGG
jgi:hypothetical protein